MISTRIIMKPFENLCIFRDFDNLRLTGPESKPLYTPRMPSSLQIPKPTTTFSKPDNTLKHQVMINIKQWRRQWDYLFVIEQSLIQLTETNQFTKAINDPLTNSLICMNRPFEFAVRQRLELDPHFRVFDGQV